VVYRHLPREGFLAYLRDAAMLVGNSSSGIIEAGSFGTPVIDIGPRQLGRERSGEVKWVGYNRGAVKKAAEQFWNDGRPRRTRRGNPYASKGRAGVKIADILGRLRIDESVLRKLISY